MSFKATSSKLVDVFQVFFTQTAQGIRNIKSKS